MPEKKPQPKTDSSPADRNTVREYIQANLLVWGFLVLLGIIAFFFVCGGVWDDVSEGTLEFLFVIMGGGFTLVSALDYLYDRNFRAQAANEEEHS